VVPIDVLMPYLTWASDTDTLSVVVAGLRALATALPFPAAAGQYQVRPALPQAPPAHYYF